MVWCIGGENTVLTHFIALVLDLGGLHPWNGEVGCLRPGNYQAFTLPFLGKRPPTHGQNGLESFFSFDGVLAKSFDKGVLDAVLDAVPAAAEGRDFGFLLELGLVVVKGAIDNDLLNVDEVGPGEIGRDHSDGPLVWIDVRGF